MARTAEFPVKKLIGFSNEMAEAISTYRFENRISTEAEAIRRLIELGLAADKAKS